MAAAKLQETIALAKKHEVCMAKHCASQKAAADKLSKESAQYMLKLFGQFGKGEITAKQYEKLIKDKVSSLQDNPVTKASVECAMRDCQTSFVSLFEELVAIAQRRCNRATSDGDKKKAKELCAKYKAAAKAFKKPLASYADYVKLTAALL